MIEMVIYFCATMTTPVSDCGRMPVPGAVYATYQECERYMNELNEGTAQAGGVPLKRKDGALIACEPKAD